MVDDNWEPEQGCRPCDCRGSHRAHDAVVQTVWFWLCAAALIHWQWSATDLFERLNLDPVVDVSITEPICRCVRRWLPVVLAAL